MILPFLKRSCRFDRSLRLLPARSDSPVFERTDVRPIIEDLCPVTSSVELPLSFFFGFDSKKIDDTAADLKNAHFKSGKINELF